MIKAILNRKILTYGLIFSLVLVSFMIIFDSQASAADDGRLEEYPTKHIENIVGQRKAKGFFGSLKSMLFGSDPLVRFSKPFGITIDESTGKIYVADTSNAQVMVFNKAGEMLNSFGEHDLKGPLGIDVAGNRVYVADSKQSKVVIFNKKTGAYIKDFGNYVTEQVTLGRPTGLAIDEERGRMYVANIDGKNPDDKTDDLHNVMVYNLKGDFIEKIGERGVGKGQFNYPVNLTVDDEGKIYVVDAINYRIQIFNPQGQFIRMFGQTGVTLGDLPRPKGIAVDDKGRIYVSDAYLHLIQVFTPQGEPLFFFGKPGRKDGRFILPADIAIDDQGRIYVVDSGNKRIQVLKLKGKNETSN